MAENKLKQKQIEAGNVKVICRFRPLNQKELTMDENVCAEFIDDQTVSIKTKEVHEIEKPKYFFDRVFPMSASQDQIYNVAAKPVIESVLEGFNGTVFAYGQTSSGKTYTMQGPNIEDQELKGIIPRMVTTVWDNITNSPDHIEFRMKISLVEIYMEKVRDLLDISKTDLKIREDKNRGIYIQDVTESYVSEEDEVYNLMKIGNSNRAISATQMNEGSSRSHSLFMMTISQNNLNDLSAKKGKLFLVDLAGSEKVGKTGASGQTLDEAKNINKSLSSLGNVINALTDGKSSHIPYRDSKLTRVLQESLGGNSRTTLIITCSPSSYNEAETISTLRFGVRAKSIKNKPKINRELTVAELQLLLAKAEKEIEDRQTRIRFLEEYIRNLGNSVPEMSNVIILENDEDDSDCNEGKKEGKKGDDYEVVQEKIRNLEGELEIERNNVKSQTEKLNNLRKEFTLLNSKSITHERENETLIHKIAEMTVQIHAYDESSKDKDDKIEQLENERETYFKELESIKQNKEHLLQVIDQKNKEIEVFEENKNPNFLISQILNSNLDENAVKHLITNLQQNGGQVDLDKKTGEISNIFQDKLKELERQLDEEREKTVKVVSLYDDIRFQCAEIMKEKYPESDFIQKLVDFEDIKNKNVELNAAVEKEKEKSIFLENYLIQTKKLLRKKINVLESNLATLTTTCHQLISQRSVLKVDNQSLEKKIIRKNERIAELEKKNSEISEESKILKSKYNSLKIMITQNELGNHVFAGALELDVINESQDTDDEKKKNMMIYSATGSQVPQVKRIVKHIRGGQGKKSLGNMGFV